MSNQNEFQYIESKEFLHLPVIEINDVKSFTKYANTNDVKFIFKITKDEQVKFFFPLNGIIYALTGGGFTTLADMQKGLSGKFPGAMEYYAADKLNISTYQEFLDMAQTGNFTKEEYDAATKAGYKDGFDKFKTQYNTYMNRPYTSVIRKDIDNPVKLHKYALEKEFKKYTDFEKVYDAGFPDMLTYTDAVAKGFADATIYYEAKKKGFNEPGEYKEATKLHIENKKEFDEYKYLETINRKRNYSFDQLQLIIALSNCENGKVFSIADAKKLLQEEQEKLKKRAGLEGQQYLPLWYKRGVDQEDQLVKFLKTNDELKKFGFYHKSKKSFEIFKASAIKILVDGSNVAFNGKSKPDLKNIRALIKELKFYKFNKIIILVDASLKRQLTYPLQLVELINDLKKEYECHEAPDRIAADQFLIAAAKKEKCRIVTNDEFRDWMKSDSWVNDNILKLRVKFRVMEEDLVILNGLEDLREKPVEA